MTNLFYDNSYVRFNKHFCGTSEQNSKRAETRARKCKPEPEFDFRLYKQVQKLRLLF